VQGERLPILALLLLSVACGARTEAPNDDPRDVGGEGGAGGDGGAGGKGGASGQGGEGGGELPTPTSLFVAERGACAAEAPVAETLAAFDLEPGDGAYAAELFFVDECSGAGGQYILARALDGSREDWLGAHACYFFPPEWVAAGGFGVVRYAQTAALFETPVGWCVSWPGGPEPIVTDGVTRAVAIFASAGEAQQFAAAVSE
jgi:hypothetical protein